MEVNSAFYEVRLSTQSILQMTHLATKIASHGETTKPSTSPMKTPRQPDSDGDDAGGHQEEDLEVRQRGQRD